MAPATATDEISPDQQIPFIVQAYYTNTAKREYNYRPTIFVFFTCPALSG
ncbi:hypothetical protein OsI_10128 [Oryza sativa Indica Group]|uniref:Uncharacterized protein n=2 Tax=Oryza sativa TaxID=4530 RepID=B9FBG7_ORYSJ|nr:hypothetical protein OsI_10128 [Oryza sativa Indica Group]EEE58369.1 hypothetical protein OsJ_09512 [Oryza sativa Japonica Group]